MKAEQLERKYQQIERNHFQNTFIKYLLSTVVVNFCLLLQPPPPLRPGTVSSGKDEEKTKSTLSHSLFGSSSHDDTGDLFSPKDKTVLTYNSHTIEMDIVVLHAMRMNGN